MDLTVSGFFMYWEWRPRVIRFYGFFVYATAPAGG